MGATMWDLQDTRYLRRDGENSMTGALILAGGNPQAANEAVRKAYVDTLTGALPTNAQVAAAIAIVTGPGGTMDLRIAAALLAYLQLAGGVMTGPLTLAGAPVNPLEAATKAYADLMLPLAGGVMLGALTLSGAPVNALHAATKDYADLMLPLAGGVMLGALTLAGAPVNALHAATKDYADLMLPLLGGVLTGVLTLAGAPVNPLEAATKAYADLMLPLGGGVMLGALTLSGAPGAPLHAATKAYVDAVPSHLAVYDAVVAPAGGDYASIVTACATEAIGARIFVKSGTYNEVVNIAMKDGQMLVGENPENTIIDFGGNPGKILSGGANHNVVVRDFTIQGSIMDNTVEVLGKYCRVTNNRIIGTAAAFDGVNMTGQGSVLENNYITGFSRAGEYCAKISGNCSNNIFDSSARGVWGVTDAIISGNFFYLITEEHVRLRDQAICEGNHFDADAAVMVDGDHVTIQGNYIATGTGVRWSGHHSDTTITGNNFNLADIVCTYINAKDVAISGNTFTDGSGITLTGTSRFTISGNIFSGVAFITLGGATTQACITGNNLAGSTAAAKIVDPGIANMAKNNLGVASLSERDFRTMKNTSGGALVAGDVVVLKAVAAGDEITTTVTQGDDMVFGMVEDANLADAAYGHIQVEGKTVQLKVNGVVAIAIGDLLGTLDAAQISMKAAAGDMAFAIALEVYAGADSLGVIDALLIKPRKV